MARPDRDLLTGATAPFPNRRRLGYHGILRRPMRMTMRKDHDVAEGVVHHLSIDSGCLKGNLLKDPSRRRIDVYVPAGHDGRGLPLLVDLVGYTAGGPGHTNWKN